MIRKKTPSFVQFAATECGAVSLYIVLGYYAKWVPLEEIRRKCRVGRDGANLANTARAAEYYGLNVELFNYTDDELLEAIREPAIIFWNKNHFLVVEGYDERWVYLSDPARGKRKVSRQEFSTSYSGYAIFLKPGKEFVPDGKRPSIVNRLALLVGNENYVGVMLAIGLGVVATIPTLGIAAVSTFFTENVLGDLGVASNGYAWILLLLTLITFIATDLLYMVSRRLQTILNERVLDRLFGRIFSLPLPFYSQRDLGELANRVTIASSLSVALTGPMVSASLGLTQIVIYSLALCFYNYSLAVLLIVLVVIQVVLTAFFMDEIDSLSKRSSLSSGRMSSSVLYMTSNIEQVKGNGLEPELFAQWSDAFSEFINTSSKTSLISQYANAYTSLANNLSDYIVIGVGGMLILTGKLSIGGFVGMRILTQGIFSPLSSATSVISAIKGLSGDVGRLFDVFDNDEDQLCKELRASKEMAGRNMQLSSKNEDNDMIANKKVHMPSRSFTIGCRDISFQYEKGEKNVVEDISFQASPSSMTAVCGPSGCGKSTLLKMLAGLVEPTDGQIVVDETNLRDIEKDSYLSNVCYLDTEVYIMHDSIISNVTLMDPSYSVENVVNALRKAQIYDVIESLPTGIHHILQADGSDLSGGQKQRIQLARLFLRSPRVALIDEGTSALDNETESTILNILREMSMTVVMATHRKGMLAVADQIVYLNKAGSIGGIGGYGELMENCRGFREMFGEEQ